MAMKKRFYSVNGQMMGYEEGGVKKDFLTDHLGSITAEIDQTQTRTYDTRYSAYGRNNWSTGTGCGFGWVGSYGYRETGLFHMSHYVRARHYSYVTGGWSTVDPLWSDESAYGYVGGRACHVADPSGKAPAGGFQGCRMDIPKDVSICGIKIDFNLPPCVGISNRYADDFLAGGNKLARCASCVSTYICEAIIAGNMGGHIGRIGGGIGGGIIDDLANQLQCQNICMYEIYKDKTTVLWKKAKAICARYGESSKECCLASVDAEQDGFTRCAKKCFPIGTIIPYDLRKRFAKEMLHCCD